MPNETKKGPLLHLYLVYLSDKPVLAVQSPLKADELRTQLLEAIAWPAGGMHMTVRDFTDCAAADGQKVKLKYELELMLFQMGQINQAIAAGSSPILRPAGSAGGPRRPM